MRVRGTLALLLTLAGAALAICPFIGMEPTPLRAVLDSGADGLESAIFWDIRVPRVAAAFLAGAGLSICGMAFQAMFRNPLATPFTLGVSSGASLGAAVAVRLGWTAGAAGISGTSALAFAGAALALSVVYGLSRVQGGMSTAAMLLAGVAVSMFFSSIILFLQYTSHYYDSFRMLRWLMGGLNDSGYAMVWSIAPFAIAGFMILVYHSNELNLLTLGEELATSRGVDVAAAKRNLFAAASLAVGGIVAQCGPIGFVGMMAPHICRLLIGPDHRVLSIASALFGGGFLVVCDTFARTILAPAQLPVGVVTAFLGGPFFIWLLVSGRATGRMVG